MWSLTARSRSLLEGPWGVRRVGAALLIIAIVDLTLGYLDAARLVEFGRGSGAVVAPRTARPVEAILDESAHALTALLLLKAVGGVGGGLALQTMVGATLIDIDHVPMELGFNVMTRGTNRPYTHSLVSIGSLLVLAGLTGGLARRSLLAVAFGVGTHLLRDAATGGVPLYWPLLAKRETMGYAVYAAIVLVCSAAALWARRRAM
jgi:inner membrane protein